MAGNVEKRYRGRKRKAKAAAATNGDGNGSSVRKRKGDSKADRRKSKKRKKLSEQPPSEASDAGMDVLDEPTPEGDLTAAKRGAYAEHLRCEPTPAAVVEALHERMKWTTKVACRPLLKLANALGCDISAKVRAAFMVYMRYG